METNTEHNYVKGFKVFYSDWSCGNDNGGYFKQYACPGTFEEGVVPEVCERGMHFCENLVDCFDYYYFSPDNKVAEVIALGDIDTNGKKSCTNKLQIVRELSWNEVLELVNNGKGNTGIQNTGNCNSGDCNEGDYNSGNNNTGDCNSGHSNRGDYNSGAWNTGNFNKGYYNTGNCNNGNSNTGNGNTGCQNIGNYNSGDCNTGDFNTGDWNKGDWNKSSFVYGCFNTKRVFKINVFFLFNKETNWNLDDWRQSEACRILESMPQSRLTWICFGDMTDEEKRKNPYAETTSGYLKEIEIKPDERQQWWNALPKSDKKEVVSLPNFDSKIFFEITGIRV